MANRTTIEIYTRQRTLMHQVYGVCILSCEHCGANVVMLSPECAARVLKVTSGAIAELCERGALHSMTTADHALLICGNSLFIASLPAEKEAQVKRR
jgi:hypothetical protein